MSCPNCCGLEYTKYGIVQKKQRYKCKSCGYRYTVRHRGISPTIKRQAFELYLEGLGFRSIGRILKCSHVAVYNWIKAYGQSQFNPFAQQRRLKLLKWMRCTLTMDQKNYCWIWITVNRNAKGFLNCQVGSRDTQTGQKLWKSIKHHKIIHFMTDYWSPYKKFIPKSLHTQSKAQTYTVEGYNGLFRHFLARLRRKSKCYCKSEVMFKYSV